MNTYKLSFEVSSNNVQPFEREIKPFRMKTIFTCDGINESTVQGLNIEKLMSSDKVTVKFVGAEAL